MFVTLLPKKSFPLRQSDKGWDRSHMGLFYCFDPLCFLQLFVTVFAKRAMRAKQEKLCHETAITDFAQSVEPLPTMPGVYIVVSPVVGEFKEL
jgi:hypothetical protein